MIAAKANAKRNHIKLQPSARRIEIEPPRVCQISTETKTRASNAKLAYIAALLVIDGVDSANSEVDTIGDMVSSKGRRNLIVRDLPQTTNVAKALGFDTLCKRWSR